MQFFISQLIYFFCFTKKLSRAFLGWGATTLISYYYSVSANIQPKNIRFWLKNRKLFPFFARLGQTVTVFCSPHGANGKREPKAAGTAKADIFAEGALLGDPCRNAAFVSAVCCRSGSPDMNVARSKSHSWEPPLSFSAACGLNAPGQRSHLGREWKKSNVGIIILYLVGKISLLILFFLRHTLRS